MKTEKNVPGYEQLYHNLLNRILKGQGYATQEQREAAFNNGDLPQPLSSLIGKVALYSYKVTDSDINAVKNTGVSEDQLFELIVCAAAGQASRQYESGLSALSEAIRKGGPHAA